MAPDHAGSGETDSKLGVQIIARPTDKFSATLHLLSKKNEQQLQPARGMGLRQIRPHPDVSLRAGRLALPGFCAVGLSERGLLDDAGARPVEVYAQLPISHLTGWTRCGAPRPARWR